MALNMPAEFVFDKIKALDRWQLLFPQDKMTSELQINQVTHTRPHTPAATVGVCRSLTAAGLQVSSIARLVAASDSMFIDDREFAVSGTAIAAAG